MVVCLIIKQVLTDSKKLQLNNILPSNTFKTFCRQAKVHKIPLVGRYPISLIISFYLKIISNVAIFVKTQLILFVSSQMIIIRNNLQVNLYKLIPLIIPHKLPDILTLFFYSLIQTLQHIH